MQAASYAGEEMAVASLGAEIFVAPGSAQGWRVDYLQPH